MAPYDEFLFTSVFDCIAYSESLRKTTASFIKLLHGRKKRSSLMCAQG